MGSYFYLKRKAHTRVVSYTVCAFQECYSISVSKMSKLARQASAKPLLGPEPALEIPRCLTREAIKNWTEYQHHTAWRGLPGHRYGKLFTGKP
jgi:hypothetical protein